MNKVVSGIVLSIILIGGFTTVWLQRNSNNSDGWHFETPVFEDNQTIFSDEDLIHSIYSDYKYPSHYYFETRNASLYYSNEISINDWDHRDNRSEVCTDEFEQALEWSNRTSQYSSVQREYISSYETEKYFEFYRSSRLLGRNGEYYVTSIYERVHKCSYFVPNELKIYYLEGDGVTNRSYWQLGTFTYNTQNQDSVKELVEYLLYYQTYNWGGFKVLSSFYNSSLNTPEMFRHYIYYTGFIGGDYDLYDEIQLNRFSYEINRTSGVVLKYSELFRTIQGQFNENPYDSNWPFPK